MKTTIKKLILALFCLTGSFLFANDDFLCGREVSLKFEDEDEFVYPNYDFRFQFSAEESDKRGRNKKSVQFRKNIFSIHAGYSPYHGFFGIEYQWQFISLNIGVTDKLSGGIKFYARRGLKDSFYWGPIGTSFDKYSVFGCGIGYRWIKESGFTINLGIAHGILVEKDSNSDVSSFMVVPSFSIGWSF